MNPRPTDEELAGMTTNEQLWACGLSLQFEAAAKARKKEEMVAVLAQLAFTRDQAAGVAEKILANPAYYGF